MSVKSLAGKMMLPFRLPQMIADRLTPKVSILASDESLERRILWGGIGSTVFGGISAIGLMGAIGMAGAAALGAVALAVALPAAAASAGAGFVAVTAANICSKTYIDSLAVKCLNAAVKHMAAEAETASVTVAPAPKTPDFNHVAATTLDKDIRTMPAIRLKSGPHALG